MKLRVLGSFKGEGYLGLRGSYSGRRVFLGVLFRVLGFGKIFGCGVPLRGRFRGFRGFRGF